MVESGLEEKRNEKWLKDWIFMELYAHYRRKASSIRYSEDGSFWYNRFERMFMIERDARLERCPDHARKATHETDLLLSIFNP